MIVGALYDWPLMIVVILKVSLVSRQEAVVLE